MILKTFHENLSGPAEFAYTQPVQCHVCESEFDREGHWEQLFDLDGIPGKLWATICEDCDIRCGWCGESVLESLPCRIKSIEDGVLWFEGEAYDGFCFTTALCGCLSGWEG